MSSIQQLNRPGRPVSEIHLIIVKDGAIVAECDNLTDGHQLQRDNPGSLLCSVLHDGRLSEAEHLRRRRAMVRKNRAWLERWKAEQE